MAVTPAFRAIASDDVGELAALVAEALSGYRGFAPAGWRAPTAGDQARVLQGWIADPSFWGELAVDGRTLIGHATLLAARRLSSQAVPNPSLAHLGHLFLRPQYWGSDVARKLLDHAMDAASARGFTAMRLFVPAGQARARRFYAREGFIALGEPHELELGLPMLEYRRALAP